MIRSAMHTTRPVPGGPAPEPAHLAPRLVLFTLHAVCDSKHDHEVRLITDGRTAVVQNAHADVERVYRDRAEVSAVCPAPIHDDEDHPAALVWDLTDSAGWGPARVDDVEALDSYGVPVVA